MTAPTAPAPGYYADPLDPSGERWWDGSTWTETVRRAAPGSSDQGSAFAAAPAVEPDPVPAAEELLVVPAVEPESVLQVPARQVPDVQVEEAQVQGAQVEEAQVQGQPATEAQPPDIGTSAVPAGLYPDPYGQALLRWWDGQQWTTQISQPVPAQPTFPPPAPPVGGRSTILPAGMTATRRVPTRGAVRAAAAAFSRSFSRKTLAGILVLVLAIGARVYFLFDGRSSPLPSPSSVASAVNLRAGDLPKTWVVPAATSDAANTSDAKAAPAGDTFDRDVARCSGAPDPSTSVTYTGVSPTWTRGAAQISSDVSVFRSPALAQQDRRAEQGSKVPTCISKVGTPPLKHAFAAKGVALKGIAASRLPNAPTDGFALRMKMTVSAHGRSTTVWNDVYGFVRGDVEVSLTQVSTGVTPDRSVAAQALGRLRARAATAVPTSH